MALKAVIFDAGNTLIRQDYAAMATALGARGHRVTAAQIEEAEQRARVDLDAGVRPGVSTESAASGLRYVGHLLAHLGITDPAEAEAFAVWRRTFNPPLGVYNQADPAGETALRAVAAAGLLAGVISNSNGSIRVAFESTGLSRHLAFVIDSSEVGVEKPDRRIFELALEAARVSAGDAVYVGDLYSVDVLGARAAGIEGILIDPGGFWGPRDCRRARDAADAVRLALGSATPAARPPGTG